MSVHTTPNSNRASLKAPQQVTLAELERKLEIQVDADFFQDPKTYKPISRVIDIIGAQLLGESSLAEKKKFDAIKSVRGGGTNRSKQQLDSASSSSASSFMLEGTDKLNNNTAFIALKQQQATVEEVIDKLTVFYCSDLNASVALVGKMANQFGEAVDHVKDLRKQVSSIRDGLMDGGSSTVTKLNRGKEDYSMGEHGGAHMTGTGTGGLGKSLREIWLKKLECESVLSLLQKLEVVRDASPSFDALVYNKPCRIGAAVVLLSSAMDTMFSSKDLEKVMGISKIYEQLMNRKQLAEEILWNTLQDILYLRTGNNPLMGKKSSDPSQRSTSSHSDGRARNDYKDTRSQSSRDDQTVGSIAKRHPIARKKLSQGSKHQYFSLHAPTQGFTKKVLVDSGDGGQADYHELLASFDSDDDEASSLGASTSDDFLAFSKPMRKKLSILNEDASDVSNNQAPLIVRDKRLLTRAVLDTKVQVVVDEMRCLQNWDLSSSYHDTEVSAKMSGSVQTAGPMYTDPVLGLRIIVDALARMNRLDDIERVLSENAEREIQLIAMSEQARTLTRLGNIGMNPGEDKFREFKMHLQCLLMAYGSILLRYTYLTQILRHRIMSDKSVVTPSYPVKSSALHSVVTFIESMIQREVIGFLRGCLYENTNPQAGATNKKSRSKSSDLPPRDQGIFSLGILSDASLATSVREKNAQNFVTTSRSNAMQMSGEYFVRQILCTRTGIPPNISHALTFRKSIFTWSTEYTALKKELADVSHEDTSSYVNTEETSMNFLDSIIGKTLLPEMQDAAVKATVEVLEKGDAFDPIVGPAVFKNMDMKTLNNIEICKACQVLLTSTSYLFGAIPKMNTNSEIYAPLVASLEHIVLTFNSRVKQRIIQICQGKTAYQLLENDATKVSTPLSYDMELRKPFTQLLNSYFDSDNLDMAGTSDGGPPRSGTSSIPPILPPSMDTRSKSGYLQPRPEDVLKGLDVESHLQREQETFEREVSHLREYLEFSDSNYSKKFKLCTEEELMKAASLAHSLLTVAYLLEKRLRTSRAKSSFEKSSIQIPRALRDPIKSMRLHGLRIAKFCRLELLMQVVNRLSVIYKSSSITSKDEVRIPTCVQELGEYLSQTSDNLRDFGGNIITAYSFSSLEQYAPLFMMQTVRTIAIGGGFADDIRITLQGVDALHKCCSQLYRDLKGCTSFENSFWDEEVAGDAFERAFNFISLMELDMEELVSLVRNQEMDFTDDDYRIMFAMNGPRRNGDLSRFGVVKERKRA